MSAAVASVVALKMNEKLKSAYLSCLKENSLSSEWWWATNNSLGIISSLLLRMNFVVVDNFLLRSEIETIQNEVKLAKENGLLSINGIVGGGRTGKDVSFENPEIRSDILGYFDGTEENWPSTRILPRVLDKMVIFLPH